MGSHRAQITWLRSTFQQKIGCVLSFWKKQVLPLLIWTGNQWLVKYNHSNTTVPGCRKRCYSWGEDSIRRLLWRQSCFSVFAGTILVLYWASVCDVGPSLIRYRIHVSCSLRPYLFCHIWTHSSQIVVILPANTKHLYNFCTTSAQRLRRRSNIIQRLYKCFVFAGKSHSIECHLPHPHC